MHAHEDRAALAVGQACTVGEFNKAVGATRHHDLQSAAFEDRFDPQGHIQAEPLLHLAIPSRPAVLAAVSGIQHDRTKSQRLRGSAAEQPKQHPQAEHPSPHGTASCPICPLQARTKSTQALTAPFFRQSATVSPFCILMELDLTGPHRDNAYPILSGLVTPRPIALVTTLDEHGRVNAAPFSFFNVLGDSPPIVGFCPGDRAPGVPKDTARNIRVTQEFVVNLVDEDLAAAMNLCAASLPAGEDETRHAGLTPLPSSAELRAARRCFKLASLSSAMFPDGSSFRAAALSSCSRPCRNATLAWTEDGLLQRQGSSRLLNQQTACIA